MSQSGQSSSSFAQSRHIKAQTAKDLGNALTAMKDSLYVTPKDPSSKFHCEAMAIVMKDTHLSTKKCMHIAMLIQSDITYAELMMGMIDASIDNNGKETNTLYQYYDEITKDMVICLGCNKDLWSQRSKYKSYGALRGCDLGARDCLQVCCGK